MSTRIVPARESVATIASMRRRRTASGAASKGVVETMLQFYTNDGLGLKISPNVMLVMSIGFIAFVAVLQIMASALDVTRTKAKAEDVTRQG
ncbi:Preprotein translocase Sec [Theobroma cacao]|uniref:Preprotein translocase Sec n=1 Tax=Theobroma cacao TaxID=3641 RepID=A0A061DKB4_THECC|nr:Preprotein translocase Sec [Theobroma cacao]